MLVWPPARACEWYGRTTNEAMGITTGVNLERLMAARQPLRAGLPKESLYGMVPEAGIPKGWSQEHSRAG
jgi:hydroxymethylglutaryl-CoA lyase